MAEPLVAAGIPVTSLRMRRGRPSLGGLRTLVRHLRRTKPDIVQTWLYHADLIGTSAAVLARPRRLLWNIRCTDITQAESKRSTQWLVRMLARLSSYPDAIVVNSRTGQSDHVRLGYHPRQWALIPNGVDLDRFRPRPAEQAALRKRLGLDPAAVVIGLVARYHPMKDVQTYLRAAALLQHRRNGVQFVLCGDGFTDRNAEVASLTSELSLQGRVVSLGRRSDMENIYPAFDIMTLCSSYGEGFPNVLCEAMACGVACVATDVGDSRDIIGDSGEIIPVRDPERLAQSWQALLERGTRDSGILSRGRIEDRYGLHRMCDQYRALYLSLAGHKVNNSGTA